MNHVTKGKCPTTRLHSYALATGPGKRINSWCSCSCRCCWGSHALRLWNLSVSHELYLVVQNFDPFPQSRAFSYAYWEVGRAIQTYGSNPILMGQKATVLKHFTEALGIRCEEMNILLAVFGGPAGDRVARDWNFKFNWNSFLFWRSETDANHRHTIHHPSDVRTIFAVVTAKSSWRDRVIAMLMQFPTNSLLPPPTVSFTLLLLRITADFLEINNKTPTFCGISDSRHHQRQRHQIPTKTKTNERLGSVGRFLSSSMARRKHERGLGFCRSRISAS